jgi:hypothetical protein
MLKDVHEESLQNPRQKNRFLCNRPDARSISIQQGVYFQKSTLFGKSLQAIRTTWQHFWTMSSSLEYSRFPFERGRDFSKDRPDARSSRPDVNPIKIKLRYF